MGINRVIATGNLTRDVELRHTSANLPVASFGLAINDRRKNQQTGDWEDFPNFVDCTLFGSRAENIARLIGKGSKVAIEGKLRYEQWEKDGQKRSKVSIVVDEIVFLSRPEGWTGNDPNTDKGNAQTVPQNGSNSVYDSRYADSDLPF